MDSLRAFSMGEANRDEEQMVFDWDKAAALIKKYKPKMASAGLARDWDYTGGVIYENGNPVKDDYTYLASTWAMPEIDLDGDTQPCYRMEKEVPEWDSATKWPESALEILGSEE